LALADAAAAAACFFAVCFCIACDLPLWIFIDITGVVLVVVAFLLATIVGFFRFFWLLPDDLFVDDEDAMDEDEADETADCLVAVCLAAAVGAVVVRDFLVERRADFMLSVVW
jgi:hypothetical protein